MRWQDVDQWFEENPVKEGTVLKIYYYSKGSEDVPFKKLEYDSIISTKGKRIKYSWIRMLEKKAEELKTK